jgi:hypothetical protein
VKSVFFFFFFLSNSAFAMIILDLILHVRLATFVVMQIIEISHFLHLFLIYHELYWGWSPWDSHYLSFSHIHFHSIASLHVLGVYPHNYCLIKLFFIETYTLTKFDVPNLKFLKLNEVIALAPLGPLLNCLSKNIKLYCEIIRERSVNLFSYNCCCECKIRMLYSNNLIVLLKNHRGGNILNRSPNSCL